MENDEYENILDFINNKYEEHNEDEDEEKILLSTKSLSNNVTIKTDKNIHIYNYSDSKKIKTINKIISVNYDNLTIEILTKVNINYVNNLQLLIIYDNIEDNEYIKELITLTNPRELFINIDSVDMLTWIKKNYYGKLYLNLIINKEISDNLKVYTFNYFDNLIALCLKNTDEMNSNRFDLKLPNSCIYFNRNYRSFGGDDYSIYLHSKISGNLVIVGDYKKINFNNKTLDYYEKQMIIDKQQYFIYNDKNSVNNDNLYSFDSCYFLLDDYKFIGKFAEFCRSIYIGKNSKIYCTIELLKELAKKTCDSKFLVQYPELLYKQSQRPINDMLTYRLPESLTMKDFKLIPEKDQWKLIRITRYSSSQMSSHFYDNYRGCGTFYYVEKESTTCLSYRTFRKEKTKYLLLRQLLRELGKDEDKANKYFNEDIYVRYLEDKETDENKYKRYENNKSNFLKDSMNSFIILYSKDPERILKGRTKIDDELSNLYAQEDDFDASLCKYANMLNVDVLIMTHMIGRYNVVEEVYDVRSRVDSFRSLVFNCELE